TLSRVLVLGAAGAVGRACSYFLIKSNAFDEIILADKRVDVLNKVFEQYRSENIVTKYIDVNDTESLKKLMKESDVVLNAVGPFYRFGPKVLRTAIDAGIDYVDVCDDYDATIEMLNLAEDAVKNKVRALIGMGSSPGLSNVIARFAADYLLDEVHSIDIYHAHGGEPYEGPAVIQHRAHSMMIDIPIYLDGKIIYTKLDTDLARKFEYEVEFPEVGRYRVYLYPHPETITLPKYIRIKNRVTNLGLVLPPEYAYLIRALVRAGLFSDEEVEVNNIRIKARDFAIAYILKKRKEILERSGLTKPVGCLMIVVEGIRKGDKYKYTFYSTAKGLGMGEGTGIPLGLGGILMKENLIKEYGVYPPEAVIDPIELFKLAKKYVVTPMGKGIPIKVIEETPTGKRVYDIEEFSAKYLSK
ncbi:MAG: saccharopine dehydrogenase NADP-binding domain-containing protein, partial [Staphylothermus sp.]|nr:saccharopine dehydrogenase NADP-binding domain-containing protein [Staphylothermus sp.]